MTDNRPASAFLSLEPEVTATFDFAAFLDAQCNLQRLRSAARATGNPRILAQLHAFLYAAERHRTSGSASDPGSAVALPTEPAPPSEVMTATQAAEALGLTSRAVRLACAAGRLTAVQVEGVWRISRFDLDAYIAAAAA